MRAAGFDRDRDVIVARRGGRPIAAAVLELGERGVHLFNLLDVVRMYAIAEGGEAVFHALLDEARGWYARRGRDRFVYFAESGDPETWRLAGLRDLGPAYQCVVSDAVLPDLLDHIYEFTAPADVPGLSKKPSNGGDRHAESVR